MSDIVSHSSVSKVAFLMDINVPTLDVMSILVVHKGVYAIFFDHTETACVLGHHVFCQSSVSKSITVFKLCLDMGLCLAI